MPYSYNSVISSTTAVSEYYAVIATPEFLRNETLLLSEDLTAVSSSVSDLQSLAVSGGLRRLENSDCIQQYSAPLNTQYSNLVVVTNSSASNSSVFRVYLAGPFADSGFVQDGDSHVYPTWICSKGLNPGVCSLDQIGTWNFSGHFVDHCLAQQLDSNSEIGLDQRKTKNLQGREFRTGN